eukprot:SAG11_NODE_7763_length_1099_cov_2.213000_1_plen_62_part_00
MASLATVAVRARTLALRTAAANRAGALHTRLRAPVRARDLRAARACARARARSCGGGRPIR